jgi:hypothetical protein
LKKWSAAATKLRRRRPGDVGVGDANTWHRRLPHILTKLLDCSSSIGTRRRGGGNARVCGRRRTGGSVAARVWVRGQGGAAAAYKGLGWLLGVGDMIGRHARGGLSGGARDWMGDGWRRRMTSGSRLSTTVGTGASASGSTGPQAMLGCGLRWTMHTRAV